MKRKALTGFTVLETVIIVIVMGIMVTVMIPVYVGWLEKGLKSEADGGILKLHAAEEVYWVVNGVYWATASPMNAADMTQLNTLLTQDDWDFQVSLVGSGYMITATRGSGNHSGKTIIEDNKGIRSGTWEAAVGW